MRVSCVLIPHRYDTNQYVQQQTPEICLFQFLIGTIQPTEEICLEAVKQEFQFLIGTIQPP